MEETRKKLRNRAEESRRKRSEGMSRDISTTTIEKSFEDDEDISIIGEKPLLHRSIDDDSDDIEELSGFSESRELRQRKSTVKSTALASN